MSDHMSPEEYEHYAVEALSEIYTDEGVATWLYTAKNKLFNNEVPIELIWRGEGDRVLAIIEAINTGGL